MGDSPCAKSVCFRDRRAPRHQEHRDLIARGVDGTDAAIGKPDIRVQHDGLSPAGHKRVAMCHPHGHMFVGHGNRLRECNVPLPRLDQPFDDWREVGTGIGKHILHPKRLKLAKKRAACRYCVCLCVAKHQIG